MAHRSLLLLILVAGFTQVPAWLTTKTDCAVSVWSVWGPTDNSGHRTRTRDVWIESQNGGLPCPPLTQTDLSPWFNRSLNAKASHLHAMFESTIKSRDILFILDMSGSVNSSEYLLAKENVAILIGKICGTIGPDNKNNRAAVITYSTGAEIKFNFDDYTDLADLQNVIRNLPKVSGSTCTGKALDLAQTIFTPARGIRPDTVSEKEVVLLTDGGSNCGPDAVSAALNLRNSRNPELVLFVFAVDDFTDEGKLEMENMATPNSGVLSDHLFHFNSYTEFKDVVSFIEANAPDPCAPIQVGK